MVLRRWVVQVISSGLLEWITATGTLLAAIVPGVLFLLERRDRKVAEAETRALRSRERSEVAVRERDRREQEERAQADLVHCWDVLFTSDDGREPALRVVNASSMPIMHLRFEGYARYVGGEEWLRLLFGYRILPPTGPEAYLAMDDLLPYDDLDNHKEGVPLSRFELKEFTFTDAAGRDWVRKMEGLFPGPLERASDCDYLAQADREPLAPDPEVSQ